MYGNILAGHGVAWVTIANGALWKLDLGDVVNRWLLYGDYEGTGFSRLFREILAGGGTVVDSGANIGQSLVYVAPLQGVRVFAFEPLKSAAHWLRECLVHHPEWNVTVEEKGLFDSPGTSKLQINGPRSTVRNDWYGSENFEQEQIELVRLDDYLDEADVERVDLWLLNVEGVEDKVLFGAERYLNSKAISAIYLHVVKDSYPKCRAYLEEKGYSVLGLDGGRLKPAPSEIEETCNFLVLPAGVVSQWLEK